MAIHLPEICLSLGATNRVIGVNFTFWLGSANLASGAAVEDGSSDLTIGTPLINPTAYVDRMTGETVAINKALLFPITIAGSDTLSAGVRKIKITPTDNSTPAQSEPFILPIHFK